jgi:hypothetical protein
MKTRLKTKDLGLRDAWVKDEQIGELDAFYAAQPWLTEILATQALEEEPQPLLRRAPGRDISNLAAYGWEWTTKLPVATAGYAPAEPREGGAYQLLQPRGSKTLTLASRTPEGQWKIFTVTNAYRFGAGTACTTKGWRTIVARWFGKRGERVVFDRIID